MDSTQLHVRQGVDTITYENFTMRLGYVLAHTTLTVGTCLLPGLHMLFDKVLACLLCLLLNMKGMVRSMLHQFTAIVKVCDALTLFKLQSNGQTTNLECNRNQMLILPVAVDL